MVMATVPTPFGWEIIKLMGARGVKSVEGLGLSEESESALREHLRGENA